MRRERVCMDLSCAELPFVLSVHTLVFHTDSGFVLTHSGQPCSCDDLGAREVGRCARCLAHAREIGGRGARRQTSSCEAILERSCFQGPCSPSQGPSRYRGKVATIDFLF